MTLYRLEFFEAIIMACRALDQLLSPISLAQAIKCFTYSIQALLARGFLSAYLKP